MRAVTRDPSFWLTISFNLYFIWYYQQNPEGFKTLLLLYWLQSAAIGISTFIQLLATPASTNPTDIPVHAWSGRGCNSLFFAFHYGAFHFVYLIFIVLRGDGPLDFRFLGLAAAIIFVSEITGLVRRMQRVKLNSESIGYIFSLPYLRIIPMHLIIVGASFSGWDDITLFLVLKTMSDILMHYISYHFYNGLNNKKARNS